MSVSAWLTTRVATGHADHLDPPCLLYIAIPAGWPILPAGCVHIRRVTHTRHMRYINRRIAFAARDQMAPGANLLWFFEAEICAM